MIFFQPEYVKNFKCDGKRCGAYCCRYWFIDIDENTLESYKKIESPAKEITSQIYYHEERKGYVTKLDEKKRCPFLTEDNFCRIQKTYGEKFLSSICQTFPRHIYKVDNLCERSLDITCPLVAEMVLLQKSPMNFELTEEFFPADSKLIVGVPDAMAENILPFVTEIQMTAIFILQRRNFTIDQRLAILGIYLTSLEKFISDGNVEKISDLTEIFTSKDFLMKNISELLNDINFQPKDFLRTLFIDVLKPFYGNEEYHKTLWSMIFDAFKNNLGLDYDKDDKILVETMTNKFIRQNNDYKNFTQSFSLIFENYLVNEFFTYIYPWCLDKPVLYNYGVFVALYKMVELILFSLIKTHSKVTLNDIIKTIFLLSINVNHTPSYRKHLLAAIEKFDDTVKIISTFLNTKGR